MCCAGKQHLDTPYCVAELVATMKQLLCSLLLTCAVACSAQAYNPDANADGLIGAEDVLSILGAYGMPFSVPLDTCSLYLTSEQAGSYQSPYPIAPEQLCSTLIVTCVDPAELPYDDVYVYLPDSVPFGTEVRVLATNCNLGVYADIMDSGNTNVLLYGDMYTGFVDCVYLGPEAGWRGSVGQ